MGINFQDIKKLPVDLINKLETQSDQNSLNANIESSEELLKTFKRLNYNLNQSSLSYIKIPRLFIDKLPADLSKITSVEKRKLLFIKSILPLILKENEKIENDRKKLIYF